VQQQPDADARAQHEVVEACWVVVQVAEEQQPHWSCHQQPYWSYHQQAHFEGVDATVVVDGRASADRRWNTLPLKRLSAGAGAGAGGRRS